MGWILRLEWVDTERGCWCVEGAHQQTLLLRGSIVNIGLTDWLLVLSFLALPILFVTGRRRRGWAVVQVTTEMHQLASFIMEQGF